MVNFPAASLMADTGDLSKTVAAIQYIDTCLGGICDHMRPLGGIVMVTAANGRCEAMDAITGEAPQQATANPVPFHVVDPKAVVSAFATTGHWRTWLRRC